MSGSIRAISSICIGIAILAPVTAVRDVGQVQLPPAPVPLSASQLGPLDYPVTLGQAQLQQSPPAQAPTAQAPSAQGNENFDSQAPRDSWWMGHGALSSAVHQWGAARLCQLMLLSILVTVAFYSATFYRTSSCKAGWKPNFFSADVEAQPSDATAKAAKSQLDSPGRAQQRGAQGVRPLLASEAASTQGVHPMRKERVPLLWPVPGSISSYGGLDAAHDAALIGAARGGRANVQLEMIVEVQQPTKIEPEKDTRQAGQ